MQTHEFLEKCRVNPKKLLVCPCCSKSFVGETGLPYLTTYRCVGDADDAWVLGYLVLCGALCVLQNLHHQGTA